jgi:hypothetical protein
VTKQVTVELSREIALAKMLAAGRKNLGDIETESEIQSWAQKTTDDLIHRGIIRIEAQDA